MTDLILLERSDIDQQSVLFRDLVDQVLDVQKTQLYLRTVIKVLKFPPSPSKVLILPQRIRILQLAVNIKDELADDEALRAFVHQRECVLADMIYSDEACDVVDYLKGSIQV